MAPTEYNARKAAAEADLDRKVEVWRQAPALPTIAKTAAWMTGLLTTAAVVGFATGGLIGAMVWPVIITLPAMAFSGLVSGLSDTEELARENFRAKAYADAGISGVRDPSRGPSLLDRLALLIGRRPAAAVEARARADLANGIWGAQPVDVRYRVMGEVAVPDMSPTPVPGPLTKIRIKADGESPAASIESAASPMASRVSSLIWPGHAVRTNPLQALADFNARNAGNRHVHCRLRVLRRPEKLAASDLSRAGPTGTGPGSTGCVRSDRAAASTCLALWSATR
jgi:hypothetical protein